MHASVPQRWLLSEARSSIFLTANAPSFDAFVLRCVVLLPAQAHRVLHHVFADRFAKDCRGKIGNFS